MSFLDTRRIPLTECSAVESRSDIVQADARAFCESFADACVELAIGLGMHQGVLLEVGTGTGAVAIRLAKRCPGVTVLGIDSSAELIGLATEAAESAGLHGRAHFQVTDTRRTKFKSEYFDGVICNHFLRRADQPVTLLNEIARIVKKDGAVLVRDLRRPSILSAWWHARWFGRRLSGRDREQFQAALRSAYSYSEWRQLFSDSHLRGCARILVRNLTHLSMERTAQQSLFAAIAEKRERREFLAETEGWRRGI